MSERLGSRFSPPSFQPTPYYLIVCEGGTEQQYFKEWERRLKTKARFKILPNVGVPLTLVQTAIKERNSLLSSGISPTELRTWCVGDLDSHPNVPKAINLAKGKKINFALSIPCLELWFYLHFVDHRAYIHRDDVIRVSTKELEIKGKNNLTTKALNTLLKETAVASSRADNLEKMHKGNGSNYLENPRSGIFRLVDELRIL